MTTANGVRVKICGLMTPEDGRAAVAAGADLLGLVLAPSRRQVDVTQARAIAAAAREEARESGRVVEIVGVFVNESPEVINGLAREIGLDRAQLSGHEDAAAAPLIDVPVAKAIRFDDHSGEAAWLSQREASLLVDARVSGSYGGAGVVADWDRAAELAAQRPLWLAGGLTPANVAAAIRAVRPAVVDVSSGVETDGAKDIAKVAAFIRAAHAELVVNHRDS